MANEEQNNAERARELAVQIAKQQVKQMIKQKVKQAVAHAAKVVAKLAAKAVMSILAFLFTNPIGWAILATLLIIALVIIVFNGENATRASQNARAYYATDETDKAYRDMEAQSYTPMSDTDHTYLDEFEYRLPWAVLEEMDTYLYQGQATTEQRQELFDALKPTYSGDRFDNDVTITYKAKAIYKTITTTDSITGETKTEQVIDRYVWDTSNPIVTKAKRHIIPTATTWSGTYTRTYTQIRQDGRINMPTPTSITDTVTDRTIWNFTPGEQTVDYAKVVAFIRATNPDIWNSDINVIVSVIQLLLENDPLDTPPDSGLADYINGGSISGGEFTWPTPSANNITSKYGSRIHPTTGLPSFHYGVDIGAAMGANVVAARDGIVSYIGIMDTYVGNYIKLDHGLDSQGRRIETRYLHLSKILVTNGQTVKAGQVIGLVGSTGRYSSGPHLHFEILVDGKAVDPMQFFQSGGGSGGGSSGIAAIDNMELFKRVMYVEGKGESDQAVVGMAEVVRNRMTNRAWASSHYKTTSQVLTDRSQFDGNTLIRISYNEEAKYQAQQARLEACIRKAFTENTNYVSNSTFFCGVGINAFTFAKGNNAIVITKLCCTTFCRSLSDLATR